ncbi:MULTISPECIES: glycosyltransferase [Aeromicrobium]|jgi:glycosyltransferase involved in cell wall biosynthesis|uniref:Glycosyltransferase subfamily 4-like N-terminal domain-containing protein n=1 Tax=Aeromicrobium erythreum TaxID=2041 RepID=A0A0U4CZI9_9ACTN|nr:MULTISPECIES: glycosyltransferase [Aeromicrobium]ALX06029.1 hypothetical protein AERYTH_15645 [Aeromicrobium erythreum]
MTTQSRRPRVLYFTKVLPYPPAVAGDAVYSRGLIETWATFADVTVVCADGGARVEDAADGVTWVVTTAQRRGRAASVLSTFPLIAWKGARRDYRREAKRHLRSDTWDAVVLDNIGSAHLLRDALRHRRRHQDTTVLYTSHEWEYPTRAGKYQGYDMSLPKRVMARWDLAKVKYWENRLIRRTDVVTVINEADLRPFRAIAPQRKYLVLSPGYDGPMTPRRTIDATTPRRIALLGGRRSEQKQQVLLDWFSVAYERLDKHGIEMAVVGDVPESLKRRVVTEYPNVDVVGFVDDLESVISGFRAGLIVDTVGSGFKLRLLSQIFQRLPIVGLESAISGLPTPPGDGYLAAESLDALATLVCAVIDDPALLDAVQNRAFDDCRSAFSWDDRARSLTAALDPSDETALS